MYYTFQDCTKLQPPPIINYILIRVFIFNLRKSIFNQNEIIIYKNLT
jgi:hypothetical protein